MENQRENFKVKVVNGEEVHIGDIVDLVYDNADQRFGESKPGLIVEITDVVSAGKTTAFNRDLSLVTGVVEFVENLDDYSDTVGMVFAA